MTNRWKHNVLSTLSGQMNQYTKVRKILGNLILAVSGGPNFILTVFKFNIFRQIRHLSCNCLTILSRWAWQMFA